MWTNPNTPRKSQVCSTYAFLILLCRYLTCPLTKIPLLIFVHNSNLATTISQEAVWRGYNCRLSFVVIATQWWIDSLGIWSSIKPPISVDRDINDFCLDLNSVCLSFVHIHTHRSENNQLLGSWFCITRLYGGFGHDWFYYRDCRRPAVVQTCFSETCSLKQSGWLSGDQEVLTLQQTGLCLTPNDPNDPNAAIYWRHKYYLLQSCTLRRNTSLSDMSQRWSHLYTFF